MNVPSIRYCTFGLALVLASLSPSLAFASGETVSTGNLGDLPPGVTVKIFFSATVDAGLPATDNQVSVQGNVTGSNFSAGVTDDPDEINANDPTLTTVPTADLEIVLDGDPATIPAGGNLTYTVTLDNMGPDSAVNTEYTVTLDPNVDYVSDTGGGSHAAGVVTFSPGTLTANGQSTADIVVTVDNPLPPLTTDITSTANATTTTDDPVTPNNTESETTTTQTGDAQ